MSSLSISSENKETSSVSKLTNKDIIIKKKNETFSKRPMSTVLFNKIMLDVRHSLNNIVSQERLLFLMFFLDKDIHGDMDSIIYNLDENQKNKIILALVLYDDIYNNGENEFTEEKCNDFESKLNEIEENPKEVKRLFLKKEGEIKRERDKVTIVFLNIILEITFVSSFELLHFKHATSSFSTNLIIGKIIKRFDLAIVPGGLRLKLRITKEEGKQEEHFSIPPHLPLILTDNLVIDNYKLIYKGCPVLAGDHIEIILTDNIEELFNFLSHGEDEKPKLTLCDFYGFRYLTETDATKFYQRINGFNSDIFNKTDENESTEKRLSAVKSMVSSEDYIKENEKRNMLNTQDIINFFGKSDDMDRYVENISTQIKKIDPINAKIGSANVKTILLKNGYLETDIIKVMSNFPKKGTLEYINFIEKVNSIDGSELEKFILNYKDIIAPTKALKKQKTKELVIVDKHSILSNTSEIISLKENCLLEKSSEDIVKDITENFTMKSMEELDVSDIKIP
jgi:hypothetical protein